MHKGQNTDIHVNTQRLKISLDNVVDMLFLKLSFFILHFGKAKSFFVVIRVN